MATPIKKIEKHYLLKTLYDNQVPVIYTKGRIQHILTVEKPVIGQMLFKLDRPIERLKAAKKLDLMFEYHGKVIFSVDVISFTDNYIITGEPEFLYRDLARSFSRVSAPPDLQVQFTFLDGRYSLLCPILNEYENDDLGEIMPSIDIRDLRGIIDQIEAWFKTFASGQKIVMFKDVKPSFIEEYIISETGKALFLPSTQGSYPAKDPYPKKCIITEELFKRYLESTGIDPAYLDEACARFIRNKFEKGIVSELWVPIRFQEYVIGYFHSWINEKGKAPIDYGILNNLYLFSKILVNSYKINGYFESGRIRNEYFGGKIVDISPSGFLFSYPDSLFAAALLPGRRLTVKFDTSYRTVNAKARIVRRFKDDIQRYFGCRFMDMKEDDLGFLYEYIYGKTFTGSNAVYLSGQV
ncbi:MAG: PilZ domain-containing protein [Treponema sp.]|jgi:hypothetical protein|nr:PilZ domain-containing protein [Treponema sp.]